MQTANDNALDFPWVTEFPFILFVFIASLVLFHFFLIRKRELSSLRWKQVDYVWLSMALVGLLGSVGAGRVMIAENLLINARSRMESGYEYLQDQAKFGSSDALCRRFNSTEYPSENEYVVKGMKERAAQCKFFRKAYVILNERTPNAGQIDAADLLGPFPPGGDQDAYVTLLKTVSGYNDEAKTVEQLEQRRKNTDLESWVKLLGPFLLAVALALRMTKVTAEVRSERSNTAKDTLAAKMATEKASAKDKQTVQPGA